jgi:hypothetical protein
MIDETKTLAIVSVDASPKSYIGDARNLPLEGRSNSGERSENGFGRGDSIRASPWSIVIVVD